MDIYDIPKKLPGDDLWARDINSIVETVVRILDPRHDIGYSDPTGQAVGSNYSNYAQPIQVFSTEDRAVGDVFGIETGQSPNYVPRMQINLIGGGGSPFGFYTCTELGIKANTWAWAIPITGYYPVLINCHPDDNPTVGNLCGPVSGEFKVSSKGVGLLCLTEPINNTCHVISSLALEFIGKVTTEITALDYASSTLGEGTVKVQKAGQDGILEDATNPATATTPWLVDVKSTITETIAVDEFVKVHQIAAIGLIADPLHVEPECIKKMPHDITQLPGYNSSFEQLISHDSSGCLRWADGDGEC